MAIYVIRRTLHSLGDAVCLEPVISITDEMIGRSDEIWLQCDERIADLYQHHPLIDRILLPEQQPPKDAMMVLDIANAEQCPSIRALMAGGKFSATQLFCDASVVNGNPLVYDGRAPRLFFSDAEKKRINFLRRSIPNRKIAFQIKGGHWWKSYPHIETLAKLLFKLNDAQLFITNDDEIPFKHQGMVPLVRLSYRDLMIWLAAMDLFIGFDSGPAHLAAAIGTRTYSMFGPTDPEVIFSMYGQHASWNKFAAPRCPRKRCWLRPCQKLLCMRALSPWDVIKDVKNILAAGYENPRLRYADAPVRSVEVVKKDDFTLPMEAPLSTAVNSLVDDAGIAIMRLDGLGGTLTLSDQAKKLHEKYDRPITLITRGYEILFENNPHIEKIINVGMRDWRECASVFKNSYPALAEIRFGLGKWHAENGNYRQDFDRFEDMFAKFPIDFRELSEHSLHHIQLTDKTLDLPYNTIESELYLDDEKFEIDGDFILVNNGVDVVHRGMRQTKVYERWNELIPLLSLRVIQVGTLDDPPIEGVADLRGQTNLKQLIYLVKKAKTIIATEGGIMHVSYAVRNPNVVILGGPTQGVLFEYPGHRWITSYICGNCWSTTGNWYERCPKDTNAICMKTISPHRIAEAANEQIGK